MFEKSVTLVVNSVKPHNYLNVLICHAHSVETAISARIFGQIKLSKLNVDNSWTATNATNEFKMIESLNNLIIHIFICRFEDW